MSYVRDFAHIRIADAEEAGGKGANLGELVSAELPVPPGFVVLRDAYLDSMDRGGVRAELAAAHAEAMSLVDEDQLVAASERLRELVVKAGISPQAREQLLAAYQQLGGELFVAVRSSA